MCERRWPSGGRSPSWLWWGERSSNSRMAAKEVAAAWVRRADQRETGCLEGWRAGSGSGFGEHADEVGSFIAPPAANFDSKDDQATSCCLTVLGRCVPYSAVHRVRLLLHRSLLVTLVPLFW